MSAPHAQAPPEPRASEGAEAALRAYAGRYVGYARVQRLLTAAKADAVLQRPALQLALDTLREQRNARRVLDVEAKARECGLHADLSWVKQAEDETRRTQSRLEGQLASARDNRVKEHVRIAFNDLGEFHLALGDHATAMKHFSQTRDFCTNKDHVIAANENLLRANLTGHGFHNVPTCVKRICAELGEKPTDAVMVAKVNVASGLAELANGNFDGAISHFLKVGIELGTTFNEVVACEDVALYVGVLALATLSRRNIKAQVLANSSFRAMLETNPIIRDALNAFVGSRYKDLFSTLLDVRRLAAQDPFLCEFVQGLFPRIRICALTQYVYPFSSVDLSKMAIAFGTSVDGLDDELARLVLDGELRAKIDRESGYLLMTEQEARDASYEYVAKAGQRYAFDVRNSILRVNLQRRGVAKAVHGRGKQSQMPVRSSANAMEVDDADPESDEEMELLAFPGTAHEDGDPEAVSHVPATSFSSPSRGGEEPEQTGAPTSHGSDSAGEPSEAPEDDSMRALRNAQDL